MSPAGRFAPSPSGDMHIGNLRTAVLAWIWARRTGRDFVMRIEDIDRVKEGAAERSSKTCEPSAGLDEALIRPRHESRGSHRETKGSRPLLNTQPQRHPESRIRTTRET